MHRIIGHQPAVEHLRRAHERGRLARAYLLTGPPGVGKTTLAIALAQTALCSAPDQRPCGVCRHCQRVERGSHTDVLLVEAGRNLGERDPTTPRSKAIRIEQVRILRQAAALSPLEGALRFFIIRNAEELTPEAADALLKTLEEPPPQSHFVLTARDPDLLPPTLVSRCQRLTLRPAPADEIAAALRSRAHLSPDEVERLAHLAQGRIGWALRAATSPRFRETHDALRERLHALCWEPDHERLAYSAALAERYERDRRALDEPLRAWALLWRDVLLLSLGHDSAVVNVDLLARLREFARHGDSPLETSNGCSPARVAAYLSRIAETARLIQSNVNARLALDVLLLHAPRLARAVSA